VELVSELAGEYAEAEGVKGLKIQVGAAPGEKCERCWHYDEEIGGDAEHPTLCPKCVAAVR
jgi:isoleucyl-tRNA synthetase